MTDQAPPKPKRTRLQRWRTFIITAIVATGVIVWIGPRVYDVIKVHTGAEISITNVPANRRIRIDAGKSCVVHLPGGKTVALWCTKARDFEKVLHESDLAFHYGEVPFKDLESEEIQMPGGSITYGEYLSYIRQGGVRSGGDTSEYTLYVDNYTLSIVVGNAGEGAQSLPLTVSVRQATAEEMIPPKQERDHYLQALRSNDPKVRLKAIDALGEMISLGSMYAGDPAEIAGAIRPLLKDQDAAVRTNALLTLRGIGDDEAILEMLTPRPIAEFAERNGAWTIAGWARHSSDRVPQHVMTFLETDDAKLQEFALAFFSCYKLPYPPAQPYVAKYLKSDVPAVRAAAASAVRFTCDSSTAASLLGEALGDASDKVLLEALTDASYFSSSIPVQRIIPLLKNQNPEVREKAARALDGCEDPAAVEFLLSATRDDTPLVRAQAAVILGRIGDPKANGRLLELLKDRDAKVRESAVNGLRWMGRREAIDAIADLAKSDPSSEVRQMAQRTVRELKQQ